MRCNFPGAACSVTRTQRHSRWRRQREERLGLDSINQAFPIVTLLFAAVGRGIKQNSADVPWFLSQIPKDCSSGLVWNFRNERFPNLQQTRSSWMLRWMQLMHSTSSLTLELLKFFHNVFFTNFMVKFTSEHRLQSDDLLCSLNHCKTFQLKAVLKAIILVEGSFLTWPRCFPTRAEINMLANT